MLVANSFDLWQKDTFFSAAEEVQDSADIMESAYRTWKREKREEGVVAPQYLDEVSRELQTALGTAKWQLEEFERAVKLSYRNPADDITTTRHRQFVAAIETQILQVEAALKESFEDERKQFLRWVTLDEDECEDLAAFLSGAPGTSQCTKDEIPKLGTSIRSPLCEKQYTKKDLDHNITVASKREIANQVKGFNDVTDCMDASYVIELEEKGFPGTMDDIKCKADRTVGTMSTWNLPDTGALEIVIDNGDEQKNSLMSNIEATPKEKGSKPFFWKPRCKDRPQAMGRILNHTQLRAINWINQVFPRVGGSQRQLQSPLHSKFSSVQFMLILMITIFLVVPFVLYST